MAWGGVDILTKDLRLVLIIFMWGAWLDLIAFQVITHSGGLPGFLTIVAFIPSQGLGLVSFINNGAASTVNAAVMYSIFDHLGDPAARRLTTFNTSGSTSLPTQSTSDTKTRYNASHIQLPTVPLEVFAGTYSDTGYGSFTLCTSAANASDACAVVLSDFAAVYPDLSLNALYASWPRLWTSHIRLLHSGGNSFKVGVMKLFPQGYGKNSTPFAEGVFGDDEYDAEFAIEDGVVKGLAFYNGFAFMAGFVREKKQGVELKDIAEVYFTRV